MVCKKAKDLSERQVFYHDWLSSHDAAKPRCFFKRTPVGCDYWGSPVCCIPEWKQLITLCPQT